MVVVELAGTAPKSDGFDDAFPREKPVKPWLCPADTVFDTVG